MRGYFAAIGSLLISLGVSTLNTHYQLFPFLKESPFAGLVVTVVGIVVIWCTHT